MILLSKRGKLERGRFEKSLNSFSSAISALKDDRLISKEKHKYRMSNAFFCRVFLLCAIDDGYPLCSKFRTNCAAVKFCQHEHVVIQCQKPVRADTGFFKDKVAFHSLTRS